MLSMETHASIPPEDWKEREITLNNALLQAQDQVHKSLCDNFDTKSVIQHLIDLVTAANTYMTKNNEKKGKFPTTSFSPKLLFWSKQCPIRVGVLQELGTSPLRPCPPTLSSFLPTPITFDFLLLICFFF